MIRKVRGEKSLKNPYSINLKDKVIVITGGSGVICSVFGEALADCGAKIALLSRSIESTTAVAEKIRRAGNCAKGYACNVLDKASLECVHQEILNDFGSCDILINGAGGNNSKATTDNESFQAEDLTTMKTFFDLDTEGVEYVFNLNFLGTLLPTQIFAKDMIGKKGASIINISSMNAYVPLTKIPAYSGAKAAVSNLTEWLAVHFSKAGIRCNGIAPGFFATKQNEALLYKEDGKPTDRTDKILAATPMGRFGEAKELIGTILYLASEEASGFVNGTVIPVDGGFLAYSGV